MSNVIKDNTQKYCFFHTINLIVVNLNRWIKCLPRLAWSKIIKFDFLKLIDSLSARHHCVNLHISELEFQKVN